MPGQFIQIQRDPQLNLGLGVLSEFQKVGKQGLAYMQCLHGPLPRPLVPGAG